MDTSTSVTVKTDALGRALTPRRLRTLEEKQRILAEAAAPGVSVAEVARRHGVNSNLVFSWRRQHEQGVLGLHTRAPAVKLLPVQVRSEPELRPAMQSPATARCEGRIEITLAKDVRIAIIGAVAVERLEQVLTMLRRSS